MSQLSFNWDEVEEARYDPRGVFESADQQRLASLPEGQHFDRKSARIEARKLAETICAFANARTPRGGVIAVGIRDDGTVEGFRDVGEDKLNSLMRARDQFCPSAHIDAKTEAINGDSVLLIFVHQSQERVVSLSNGDSFIRIGDTNRRLQQQEVDALRRDRGELSTEMEVIGSGTIDSLDPELVAEYVTTVREGLGLEFDTSPEDILTQRKLGVVDAGVFRPRLAGLLALGKDPIEVIPGSKIRFIRYEGSEERTGQQLNVIKDAAFVGPVPVIIRDAISMVLSQLREFRALKDDGSFELRDEYPHDCVREAIVNASVHRSYGLRNAPVFVRMFDDRLEIESPGGFFPPVTAETVYEHHSPRNPFLMEALQYLSFVRMANEGTRRMRHLMERSHLPLPDFAELAGPMSKVVVTLHNNIQHRRAWVDKDLSGVVSDSLAASLSDEEKRVLNYLAENGQMNVSDAFRITSVKTWHSARRIMDRLIEKGVIKEIREDKVRDPKAHFVLSWSGK